MYVSSTIKVFVTKLLSRIAKKKKKTQVILKDNLFLLYGVWKGKVKQLKNFMIL